MASGLSSLLSSSSSLGSGPARARFSDVAHRIRLRHDGGSRRSPGAIVCSAGAGGQGQGGLRHLALDVRRPPASSPAQVTVDNDQSADYTVISVRADNVPGLLQLLTRTFRDLGLDVSKASVDLDGEGRVNDQFFVLNVNGEKITNSKDINNVKQVIQSTIRQQARDRASTSSSGPFKQFQSRPITFHYHGAHDVDTAPGARRRTELLYSLMDTYIKNDVLSIQKSIVDHVEYTVARSRYKFDDFEAYQATAYSVRDRLIESWNDTQQWFKDTDPKRVYYLSMEFLMGRSLLNSIQNLGLKGNYAQALEELGFQLEVLVEQERDAALGNGGLGRLAACFLDSMASLNYPAWGYGIRYQYGMFRQVLQDGFQHEQPDYWLTFGNPWEIERVLVSYPIRFYGQVEEYMDQGHKRKRWVGGEGVEAVAYDNPIPGYQTNNTINLRLWAAKPSGEFDLESFNTGDYVNAILNKQRAEAISSVLYPDDRTYQGKELRLKQQHFFASATLQDIVRRYKDRHEDFTQFADKVAVQLNDTHPAIGVIELMRLLVDEEKLDWHQAWNIVTHVFSYTNHNVVPEALEMWPVDLLGDLLPRHLEIIYDINFFFLEDLKKRMGNDFSRLARMSVIEEGASKSIRMATLAVVASHTINGVSHIHTQLLKTKLFPDFYDVWPHKFQNKTNGVTQRRWLAFCNPGLADVITHRLGTEAWITDLDLVAGLLPLVEDPELQAQWIAVKRQNKARLALYIKEMCGVEVSPDAMFDVQVKRVHEYKRQLLNIIGIIHRYDCIKKMSAEERKRVVPRVCLLGGKAAPGYETAKRIIKLVSALADVINNDSDVGHLLKLAFIPDYNVSVAELIIPAAEVSQHISLAGNEASGTGVLKFAMNGCLVLGTYDGANLEVAEEIGEDNMFLFGVKSSDVPALRESRRSFSPGREFTRVVGMIRSGTFGWADYFQPLCDLIDGPNAADFYLLANDFPSYLRAQAKVDATYADRKRWTAMSISSCARMGRFSSDRTIKEYADNIWGVKECNRPF